MTDQIQIKDYHRFTAALDGLDAAHSPLPETAAVARQVADEAAAGAAGATGSVADATASFLAALGGSVTTTADTTDTTHSQLWETTFDMRGWNGGMESIQDSRAKNIAGT
ncbi:hypothetical protein [Mycobacterium sp. SMC-19]|uniref:hypothetical protein n=1 Tax=Mycobacterium sp. SMC-19 TaxID=3381630 RepID=UPI003876049D